MKLEYKIIEAGNARTLEERVADHLQYGCKLCGGVCVYRDRHEWVIYSQAVTK